MESIPLKIHPIPGNPRVFIHEPTGEMFGAVRGGTDETVTKYLLYHGPGKAIHPKTEKAVKVWGDRKGKQAASKSSPVPAAAPAPVEMTEDERAIRNDLKALLANTKQEPGAYLAAIAKIAIQLSKEWVAYQTAERAKMKVPVDGFLVPEPEGD